MQEAFLAMSSNPYPVRQIMEVQGRKITIPFAAGSCALFSFDDLCGNPLGAADYIAICERFKTILIAGIPILTPEQRNEAKRFVILIDTLYEHHTILICSAEAPPEAICPAGNGAFEFERTVSRLMEMQSDEYLNQSSDLMVC